MSFQTKDCLSQRLRMQHCRYGTVFEKALNTGTKRWGWVPQQILRWSSLGGTWSHLVHFTAEEMEVICLLAFFPICLKRGADGLSCLRQEMSIWQTPQIMQLESQWGEYLTHDMVKHSLIPQLFYSSDVVHHHGRNKQNGSSVRITYIILEESHFIKLQAK